MACLCSLPGPKFPRSGDKNVSPPSCTGRNSFTPEIYFLLSGETKEGHIIVLALSVSQITLIQNKKGKGLMDMDNSVVIA